MTTARWGSSTGSALGPQATEAAIDLKEAVEEMGRRKTSRRRAWVDSLTRMAGMGVEGVSVNESGNPASLKRWAQQEAATPLPRIDTDTASMI